MGRNKYFILVFLVALIWNAFFSLYKPFTGFDYIFYFFLILSVTFSNAMGVIAGYVRILFVLVIFIVAGNVLSPYSPSLVYSILGSLLTISPFLLFIVGFKRAFTYGDLSLFIDYIIKVILVMLIITYFESIFFRSGLASNYWISSRFFRSVGFSSSMSNLAISLCFGRFVQSKERKYIYYVAFFLLTIIFNMQMKSFIAGLLLVCIFIAFFSDINKFKKYRLLMSLCIGTSFVVIFTGFIDVLLYKLSVYTVSDATDNIARNALYDRCVEIANDFFPFGCGQGTFGSPITTFFDSKIYYDYNLSSIWGLAFKGNVNFKLDVYWSSIIGEIGYIGAFLYCCLFFYPLYFVWKMQAYKTNKGLFFIVFGTLFTVFVESFTLNLPGQIAWIVIYSCLNGIICRYIYNEYC